MPTNGRFYTSCFPLSVYSFFYITPLGINSTNSTDTQKQGSSQNTPGPSPGRLARTPRTHAQVPTRERRLLHPIGLQPTPRVRCTAADVRRGAQQALLLIPRRGLRRPIRRHGRRRDRASRRKRWSTRQQLLQLGVELLHRRPGTTAATRSSATKSATRRATRNRRRAVRRRLRGDAARGGDGRGGDEPPHVEVLEHYGCGQRRRHGVHRRERPWDGGGRRGGEPSRRRPRCPREERICGFPRAAAGRSLEAAGAACY